MRRPGPVALALVISACGPPPEDPAECGASVSLTIMQPGGTFTGTTRVEIEPGHGAVEIWYSTDGSEPNRTAGRGTLYEGPIAIEENALLRARAYDPGGCAGPVESEAYLILEDDVAAFTSNLPIVVIDALGRNIDARSSPDGSRPFRSMAAAFIDTDGAGTARITDPPDHAGHCGMHVRGSSTADEYPKKQYALETWDESLEDVDVSLLGFPAESDWILHAPYSDKTLMRNHLMYTWSRRIGRYAARTRFVELFHDTNRGRVDAGDYRGVYVFMEKVKRGPDRVAIADLDPEHTTEPAITGGYLLKKDWVEGEDGRDYLETEIYRDEILYVSPKPENVTSAQRDWITSWLNTYESALASDSFADPEAGYEHFIDVESFIDHSILVEISRNVDGYVLSTFLHKDRSGKLVMGPIWDYNGSLGNADYFDSWLTEGWHHENPEFPVDNPRAFRWYERLLEDPEFRRRYAERWAEHRADLLSTENLLIEIDETAAFLTEPAARNFERWPVLGEYVWPNDEGCEDRTTYEEEIAYLEAWLEDRLDWMDAELETWR